jgi:hypothetical protein
LIVPIISRQASSEDVELVERIFASAGFETQLFVFGQDEDANAMVAVQLAEAHASLLHPMEVWIAPAMFARLDAEHRANASMARAELGFEQRQQQTPRLIVCTDEIPNIPPEPGIHLTSIDDIRNGSFGSDQIGSIFS